MIALSTLRAGRAPLCAFVAMGMLWGSFAADLPDIKTMLAIDEAWLGALMFMTPVAAVVAMLLAPAIGAALGRAALPTAALLMSAGFALPGQTASLWLFPVAMLVCGAGTGLTDVLMNARVASIEADRGLHLMSLCYAGYSLGYGGAAVGVGVMRSAGWSPAMTLGTVALLAAVLSLGTIEANGRIDGLKRPKDRSLGRLGIVPVLGGAIILISFMTENAAENWSALHIEKTLGGSPAHGALGPATMAFTMAVVRLFNQGLTKRLSEAALLTWGTLISASGALTAALATSPAMAYLGFFVMAVGASVIAPTTFSLIGRLAKPEARARAIARATLLGYFGYFFGPPLVGFIAGSFGLRFAFVFAAVMLAGVPFLVRILLRRGPV